MIVRKETTYEALAEFYEAVNRIIKEAECYYTEKEIKKLKEDKRNIFLKKEEKNDR